MRANSSNSGPERKPSWQSGTVCARTMLLQDIKASSTRAKEELGFEMRMMILDLFNSDARLRHGPLQRIVRRQTGLLPSRESRRPQFQR
jgi:hypothetical protein